MGGDEVLEYEAPSSECALSCGDGGVEGRSCGCDECSMIPTPSCWPSLSGRFPIGMMKHCHIWKNLLVAYDLE